MKRMLMPELIFVWLNSECTSLLPRQAMLSFQIKWNCQSKRSYQCYSVFNHRDRLPLAVLNSVLDVSRAWIRNAFHCQASRSCPFDKIWFLLNNYTITFWVQNFGERFFTSQTYYCLDSDIIYPSWKGWSKYVWDRQQYECRKNNDFEGGFILLNGLV